MSKSSGLVESLMNVNFSDKEHHLLLKVCEEQHALFDVNGKLLKRVVANVNRRLSDLKTRASGLQLLKILLNHCPGRVLKKHWIFWTMICTRAAENAQFSNEASNALWVLIETSHHFQLPTKSLSKCIEMVLTYVLNTSEISTATLRSLELLLCYYRNDCKHKMDDIWKFLLRFLDEENVTLIEAAGKCMCYIPLLLATEIKGGQFGGDLQTKLCTTGTLLMDELIKNTYERSSPVQLPVEFQLVSIQKNTVLTIYKEANRLQNILKFIERMFIDDLDNAKRLYADSLVAMAQHILEVNLQTRRYEEKEDDVALWCVLPNIQMAAFKLLRTFVCCNLNDVQKYGPVFGKLIMQTLKHTSSGHKVGQSVRQLREEVYKFLESWVLRERSSSYVDLDVEELISQILMDIQKKGTGYSKKHKGRCESLSEMALLSLNTLILTGGSKLSCSMYSKLEEMVVCILLKIQQSSGIRDIPSPYNTTGCRLQIYRLLHALTLCNLSELFFDAQNVHQFFLSGEKDCSPEIAAYCTMALASTSASSLQNNTIKAQKRKWKKTTTVTTSYEDATVKAAKFGQNQKRIRFGRKKLDSSTDVIICTNGKWKVEKMPVEVMKNTGTENLKYLETSVKRSPNDVAIERCSEEIKSYQCSCNKQSTGKNLALTLIDCNMEEISWKLTAEKHSCNTDIKNDSFSNKDKVKKECSQELYKSDRHLEVCPRCKLNTVKSPDKSDTDVRKKAANIKIAGIARSFSYLCQYDCEKKLSGQSSSVNSSRSISNSLKSDTEINIENEGKGTDKKHTFKLLDCGSDLDVDVEDVLQAYVTPKVADSLLVNGGDSKISEESNLNSQGKRLW